MAQRYHFRRWLEGVADENSPYPEGVKTLANASAPGRSTPRLERLAAEVLVGWHLCSLDAPTVSVAWAMMLARAVGARLPGAVAAAMFVAVWMIYAADRLLDVGRGVALEARHRFHGRHRVAFRVGLLAGGVVLAGWLAVMPRRMLGLYLVLGAGLALWLALIHHVPARFGVGVPKELVVGLFFGAAVAIPAMALSSYGDEWGLGLMTLLAANLCGLNCLFIYRWEHAREDEAHASTQLGLRRLRLVSWASVMVPLVAMRWCAGAMAPVLLAASLGAALLMVLDRVRMRLEPTTLRAAADVAMLTPLLFLWMR